MKGKKFAVTIAAVMAASMILLTPANAVAFPNLPPEQVSFVLTLGPTKWPGTVVFSGISGQAGGPFDVSDGTPYTAWCDQFDKVIVPGDTYMATLASSLGMATPWDKINFLLNHNTGEDLDEQVAIWLLFGFTPAEIAARYPGQPSADANSMYNMTSTVGAGFVPGPGQLVAVEVVTVGEDAQDLIIQLTIPSLPPGFTPGFWKHNIGVALGINPGKYSAFSGGPLDGTKLTLALLQGYAADVGVTLQEAYAVLSTGGGGAIAQARIDMANAFNAAAGYGPFVED